MTGTAKRKGYPLSMRLPEGDIAMIDRAAEEVLMESTLLRMTPEGFAAFVQAVSAPATPVPEMVASLHRKAPWENGAAKR